MEKCSDVLDLSSVREQFDRDILIKKACNIRGVDSNLVNLDDRKNVPCYECGEIISEKRLKAIPGTTLCIKCASKAEDNDSFYGKAFVQS